jgi:hypothetical protein
MGVWGSGLYSGDFAMDVRATIRAVVRLPFDPDRLTEILCESEREAATDPSNEEHTTFWLIVADQFARRGIVCDRVRKKALEIIDGDSDIKRMKLEKIGSLAIDPEKLRIVVPEKWFSPRISTAIAI